MKFRFYVSIQISLNNAYGDMYKINDSNIRKVEERVETLEEDSGVNVPPELRLEPLTEAA